MLKPLVASLDTSVTIFQVLEQPVFLVYEQRPGPPGAGVACSGELAAMILGAVADTGKLRNFYGSNRIRVPSGAWLPV